jgi:ABC-2 type transport system permease protein
MNKTWLIMKNEIRVTLGRKTFTLFAFGLPVVLGIIALVTIVINNSGDDGAAEPAETQQQFVEGYVDPGNLIQSLPENVMAEWLLPFADEAAARQALEAGDIRGYYLIAADYLASGDVRYVKETFDPIGDSVQTQGMEWILLYNLAGGDISLAGALWQPLNLEMTSLAPAIEEGYEDNWFVEMMPTLMTVILYMVILIAASALIAAVAEEKKNRVMEILLSSVTPNQFIGGKILALGFLGFLMFLAYVGIMWMVANFGGQGLNIPEGYELPTNLLVWATIFAVLGYAMYGSLMAGLGALAPDVKDTRSTSLLLLSPMIAAYMFNIVVIANPNGPIAMVLSLFPLTSPVSMISRMTVTDVPLWQLILAAFLQLLTALIIVRLVARLFRAQILLSGAAPSQGRYLKVLIGRAA